MGPGEALECAELSEHQREGSCAPHIQALRSARFPSGQQFRSTSLLSPFSKQGCGLFLIPRQETTLLGTASGTVFFLNFRPLFFPRALPSPYKCAQDFASLKTNTKLKCHHCGLCQDSSLTLALTYTCNACNQ